MPRPADVTADEAEALAIQALTFLAEDAERISRFLAVTGLGPSSLRGAARDPRFLAGVLEYLVGNESLLRGFAGAQGIDPAAVATAQRVLSGPESGRDGG
jgi:hypothetical protein